MMKEKEDLFLFDGECDGVESRERRVAGCMNGLYVVRRKMNDIGVLNHERERRRSKLHIIFMLLNRFLLL